MSNTISPTTQEPALAYLHHLYEVMGMMSTKVEELKGESLCAPDCGLCCETTTPVALLLEGRNAALWLDSQSIMLQDKVLKECEKWLLRPMLYKAVPGKVMPPPEWDELMRWPCPFLDAETKACIIHPVRPLSCRAYGVTRPANAFCKAPLSDNEEQNKRTYFSGPPVDTFVEDANSLVQFLAGVVPDQGRCGFLPFFIYNVFAQQRLTKMIDFDRVHYAKMAASPPGRRPWTITNEDVQAVLKVDASAQPKIVVAHH